MTIEEFLTAAHGVSMDRVFDRTGARAAEIAAEEAQWAEWKREWRIREARKERLARCGDRSAGPGCSLCWGHLGQHYPPHRDVRTELLRAAERMARVAAGTTV